MNTTRDIRWDVILNPYGGVTGVDTRVCLELKNVLYTPEKDLLSRVMVELSIDTSFISARRVLIVVE